MTQWLLDEDWLPVAERLSLGGTRKVPHVGCSNSQSMRVSHDEDGIKAYCFKCQRYGFKAHKIDTIEQAAVIDAHRKAKRQQTDGVVRPPSDLTHPEADPKALSWLLGHGIKHSEIAQHNIQYSPSLQRVFIPVWIGGTIVNYIGRTISTTEKCKWWALTKNPMPYFASLCPCYADDVGKCVDACVIVEDILSAIKVGRHCDTYALMGTTLSDSLFVRLKLYRTILVWTDGDVAGDKAFDSIKAMCNRYYPQKSVHRIRTKKDPKCYDNERIIKEITR